LTGILFTTTMLCRCLFWVLRAWRGLVWVVGCAGLCVLRGEVVCRRFCCVFTQYIWVPLVMYIWNEAYEAQEISWNVGSVSFLRVSVFDCFRGFFSVRVVGAF